MIFCICVILHSFHSITTHKPFRALDTIQSSLSLSALYRSISLTSLFHATFITFFTTPSTAARYVNDARRPPTTHILSQSSVPHGISCQFLLWFLRPQLAGGHHWVVCDLSLLCPHCRQCYGGTQLPRHPFHPPQSAQ